MNFEPIGIVKSPVTEPVDAGWGSVVSEIHINPELAPGLKGIMDWSHVVVLFYMHEVTFDKENDLVRRPRGQADMPELGIFAQRARNRPNSIGISAVKLMRIKDNVLFVKGLDAIDGTPVLDIKPYAPVYDGVYEPEVPIWFIRLMQGYF